MSSDRASNRSETGTKVKVHKEPCSTSTLPARHRPGWSLTSLPAVTPSLKVLDGLGLDDVHVFPKVCNVQSSLEHLFLLQEDLFFGGGNQRGSVGDISVVEVL